MLGTGPGRSRRERRDDSNFGCGGDPGGIFRLGEGAWGMLG